MTTRFFFCGIGGSGMLPLALILAARGASVSGSDRSYDQGKTPDKFAWIESQGMTLYPQDGSGVSSADILVVSTAVEDSIPDVRAAKEKKIPIQRRAELLATLFNDAGVRIAVAGTSGKSTVTAMIGFILKECGLDPTVMNGAALRAEGGESSYATAMAGRGDVFVTEADESDGSIALYRPTIGVLNNIALDHKSMDELIALFTEYAERSDQVVMNVDNLPVSRIAGGMAGKAMTYSLKNDLADMTAQNIRQDVAGVSCDVICHGRVFPLSLPLPGLHNLSNALAALCAVSMAGVDVGRACRVLGAFRGVRRRLETVGTKNGVVVIDDFAHNPDKIEASLKTLKSFPGRLKIFFQPHGYGFLKLMHREAAAAFAAHLTPQDELYLIEPFYAGGTADRSVTSSDLADCLRELKVNAHLCADRAAVKTAMLSGAVTSDRLVVMGARDDTLSEFAMDILSGL
jgi:UDP-N-acetylmuramate--alanine ligase